MTQKRLSTWRGWVGAGLMLVLTGCGAMPASGPTVRDITDNAVPENSYAVISLTPAVLTQLDAITPPSLLSTFGAAAPAPVKTLSPGDIVSVTIWDTGGGLFSPVGPSQAGTPTTVIATHAVDSHGNITVPFAGQVHVAGKSTAAAQQAIMGSLGNQTVRPQALISLVTDQSNLVTVIGEVKTPGRVLLNPNGTRALDAIAMAGGTMTPAYDNVVQLTRKGVTSRMRLSWMLSHAAEDVYLKPDDVLYVVRDPVSISILGAVKNNVKVDFTSEQLSLAEALGQSGGLVDELSEPAGVFVFRMEPVNVVAALKGGPAATAGSDQLMPVIFRADLRHAQDFFLAQSFKMQNKDLVYVANAEITQIDKVLKVLMHAAGIYGSLSRRSGSVISSN